MFSKLELGNNSRNPASWQPMRSSGLRCGSPRNSLNFEGSRGAIVLRRIEGDDRAVIRAYDVHQDVEDRAFLRGAWTIFGIRPGVRICTVWTFGRSSGRPTTTRSR